MKNFIWGFSLLFCNFTYAQTRIVINNDANIVLSNGVNIVVDNANTNAIATSGTGGNIISEAETNIIKWNIGTSSGNYIVPFTTFSGNKIPVHLNISTPGSGTGSILFSTYNGISWNNDTYKPSGVTNMTNMAAVNNSSDVIDRFWMIEATGYITKPAGDLQLTYIDAEHTAIGNTITETDLKAERYEGVSDNWETFPVAGVVDIANNNVSGIYFSNSDFMRVWTLLDQTTHTLPLTLLNFDVICEEVSTILTWSTAQEQNTSRFIISSSLDGINFIPIATIPAVGKSETTQQYQFVADGSNGNYYQLTLENDDLSQTDLGVVYSTCENAPTGMAFAFASGLKSITLQTTNLPEGDYAIQLYDLQGHLLFMEDVPINNNFNSYLITNEYLSAGIYILKLFNRNTSINFSYTQQIQFLR